MKKVKGIILRDPTKEDLAELKAKIKLSEQHFGGYVSLNAEGITEAEIGTFANDREIIRLIIHKGAIVGYMACCLDTDFALRAEEHYNKGGYKKCGSLIYAVFVGYARQGFMYTALQSFIRQLVYLYNYDRIFAMVKIENIASIGLLQKLNFLELPDFISKATGNKLKVFAASKVILENNKKLNRENR